MNIMDSFTLPGNDEAYERAVMKYKKRLMKPKYIRKKRSPKQDRQNDKASNQ